MLLAFILGYFFRLRLVLLLRPGQRHRMGEKLRFGREASHRFWQTDYSLLYWQVVRPL